MLTSTKKTQGYRAEIVIHPVDDEGDEILSEPLVAITVHQEGFLEVTALAGQILGLLNMNAAGVKFTMKPESENGL